ncbi:hook-length control protein FliK [Methylophilus rhizosphaerae]|uniref:Hook-length control protein FliK n=1 Tax=Methylophilus rhizosphaerae TaxID=492660 RepID=A0A1G8ZCU0_9PROT|nr:hook-length control protein FliK [Methylophilus rhizosphaerae]
MLPIPQVLSPRNISQETEGLRAVSLIAPVEGTQAEAPLWSRLRPGAQFTGQILQKESPNTAGMASFKVEIQLPDQKPALVYMQLPAHLAQQQALQMQYLGQSSAGKEAQAAYPQVRWSLADAAKEGNQPGTGLVSAGLLANTAQHGSTEGLALLLHAMPGQASQVDLSNPAQQLQRWINSPMFQQQAMALQAQAVVSHSPQKPQVLARDLKHALDSSGLFYESHLKEATLGSRPWHQLLQEPQNKPQFIAPEMVAQQLQVLEQQRVIWHGEIWPGQHMQWEVSERDPSPNPAEDPAMNTLQSDLTLKFPRLGDVVVRIVMTDGRLAVHMQAEADETLQRMQAARSQLAGSLHTAGLAVTSLQISRDTPDSGEPSHATG